MSYVKRVGDWEIENSITEKKVFVSDQSGKLLAEFDYNNLTDFAEWIHENI